MEIQSDALKKIRRKQTKTRLRDESLTTDPTDTRGAGKSADHVMLMNSAQWNGTFFQRHK
jgi:hypothetical protein